MLDLEMKTMYKSYYEACTYDLFADRLNYLLLKDKSFKKKDSYRSLRQFFYRNSRWRKIRDEIILRDNGCDLGIKCLPILGNIYVHHIQPITLDDINYNNSIVYDPNNLICVSLQTHNMIHYGIEPELYKEREPNDTILWR